MIRHFGALAIDEEALETLTDNDLEDGFHIADTPKARKACLLRH